MSFEEEWSQLKADALRKRDARMELASAGSGAPTTSVPGNADLGLADAPISSAARDDYLRLLMSDDHVPSYVVTAGNWTIQFCDTATGREAAHKLGGAVVDHETTE